MVWLGHVWRENTCFVIGARTEAFNAPTGHVFTSVFEGDQNMRYIPKHGFLGVIEWIGDVWRENTSFIIDARTGSFNAPTGHVFLSVFEADQNMR